MSEKVKADLDRLDRLRDLALCGPEEQREEAAARQEVGEGEGRYGLREALVYLLEVAFQQAP